MIELKNKNKLAILTLEFLLIINENFTEDKIHYFNQYNTIHCKS